MFSWFRSFFGKMKSFVDVVIDDEKDICCERVGKWLSLVKGCLFGYGKSFICLFLRFFMFFI